MGNIFCCVQVDQSTVAIKERFSRFEDVLEPGCHCLPWFLGSQLAGHLSLRLQASVPKLNLDDVFEQKTEIAKAVEEELEKAMSAYGYEIVQTLIVDIEPDEHVKCAMNEINGESPGSSGYLIVDANGGLNQQRSAAKIEAQILAAEALAKMKAEVELKKQREREEKLLELHYKSILYATCPAKFQVSIFIKDGNWVFGNAKKLASQYQKEADKCNSGMETYEEVREKPEEALSAQMKLTAMWEIRARQKGWGEKVAKSNAFPYFI
ncbi:hypothetical protein PVK06_011686 [Gossypium arboreum]|uniref:Band 7 domain-containing protein n=1 Tax=Gossypium arboreum TaxID=29729 RepID=A0ABR0Q9E5_GOSAR|nr:hypothetical protein PVK06_011686 [Gossypium arboreum]